MPRPATVAVPLRERDLDHQNHVYHGVMLTLLDEGRVRFYAQHLNIQAAASYVVVRVELDYMSETVLADGPLAIEFSVQRAGNSSIRTVEKVFSSGGQHLASAVVTCVLWDAEARIPRALTTTERASVTQFADQWDSNGVASRSERLEVMESER